MSVTCDARPTITFLAAKHHSPLAGTKLYCLVTEAHVLTTSPPKNLVFNSVLTKPLLENTLDICVFRTVTGVHVFSVLLCLHYRTAPCR